MKQRKLLFAAIVTALVVLSYLALGRPALKEADHPITKTPDSAAMGERPKPNDAIPKVSPAVTEPSSTSADDEPAANHLAPVVFHQDPFKSTPTERLVSIKNGISVNYAKVIEAMGLTPDERKKLMNLLILRAEAAYVAHTIVENSNTARPGDLKIAIEAAQADVDAEILRSFGKERSAQISAMIAATPFLTQVGMTYEPALYKAGDPMSPDQALPLAEVLMETYGVADFSMKLPSTEGIDPKTGLLPIDEIAISRAAKVLRPEQLEVFRKLTVERNLNYIKHR
jgi:hypothetical protein